MDKVKETEKEWLKWGLSGEDVEQAIHILNTDGRPIRI